MKDWKWWGEQVGHFIVAGALTWAGEELIHLPMVASVGTVCFGGALREITQNHGDVGGSLGDSIFDAAAWCLGAVIAGLVF